MRSGIDSRTFFAIDAAMEFIFWYAVVWWLNSYHWNWLCLLFQHSGYDGWLTCRHTCTCRISNPGTDNRHGESMNAIVLAAIIASKLFDMKGLLENCYHLPKIKQNRARCFLKVMKNYHFITMNRLVLFQNHWFSNFITELISSFCHWIELGFNVFNVKGNWN